MRNTPYCIPDRTLSLLWRCELDIKLWIRPTTQYAWFLHDVYQFFNNNREKWDPSLCVVLQKGICAIRWMVHVANAVRRKILKKFHSCKSQKTAKNCRANWACVRNPLYKKLSMYVETNHKYTFTVQQDVESTHKAQFWIKNRTFRRLTGLSILKKSRGDMPPLA